MRRIIALVLLALIFLGMSGCNSANELEKQAYVLVLGLDRLENGDLMLTAKVPRNGSASDPESGGGQGEYLLFSASGESYAQALEALQWATPRQMNLSHIEMIVTSERLAREDAFGILLAQIAKTPHLYATARFVVCEGMASEFIEAQQTVIGSRLSEDIDTMLNHYASEGYIPDSSLADVYYRSFSFYSDPVAAWGYIRPKSQKDISAASLLDIPAEQAIENTMEQRFAGAVLFRNGVMIGTLDLQQNRLLSLILGKTRSTAFEFDGLGCTLTPIGTVQKQLGIEDSAVSMELSMTLEARKNLDTGETSRLETELSRKLEALVFYCQELEVDPFGFAEAGASQFLTYPEWQAFGWRDQYANAKFEAHVSIRQTGDS